MTAYMKYPSHLINYSKRDKEKWSDEEIAKLLQLRADKVPYRKIASILERKYSTIARKLWHYKLLN